jgi:hypothetical protein
MANASFLRSSFVYLSYRVEDTDAAKVKVQQIKSIATEALFETKMATLKKLPLSVPGTGFEPAQPFGCCHLKTVRLPISPPGLLLL